MDRDTFERVVTHTAKSLRVDQKIANESQRHGDQLLTWAIVLMGVGILLGPPFLASLGAAPIPKFLVLGALVPWMLGVGLAGIGRFLAIELKAAWTTYFTSCTEVVDELLLQPDPNAGIQQLQAILKSEGEHARHLEATKVLQLRIQGVSYLAQVALPLGMLTLGLVAAFG